MSLHTIKMYDRNGGLLCYVKLLIFWSKMAMVASFSTQGFIYLHVAAGEIKLQNIGETTKKAKGKNRALTPLTPSPNYRGWSVLGCRRMCLAQHHCDNNPGIMSSVLQMTGLSNMSTSHPRHHRHSHRSLITTIINNSCYFVDTS